MRKTTFLTLLLTLCFVGFQTVNAQSNNRLFFVFLNTNPDKPEISESEKEKLQTQHLANLDRLAREGTLKAAGPFDGGGGLVILKADTEEAAWELINSDPAVQANRFKVEVHPFALNGNQLCGAKEPYEMVTYQFVRLISNVEYFGDIQKMVYDDRFFMAELNNENDFVIAYGKFSDYNDGMIILDVTDPASAERIMKEHPAVKAGQLDIEVKPLWIAKGTFCKK